VHGAFNYKTVNIYSLSLPTWKLVEERLKHHISAGHVNEYYETVFAEMIAESILSFKPVFFDAKRWYEIDTLRDLRAADLIFPENHQLLTHEAESI